MLNYLAKFRFSSQYFKFRRGAPLLCIFGAVPRLRYKLQPAAKELKINSSNILQIHNLNILDIFTINC